MENEFDETLDIPGNELSEYEQKLIQAIEDDEDDLAAPDLDEVEKSREAIKDLKFGLFLTICRAPLEATTDDDRWMAWKMLEDEDVLQRLDEKGALDEAKSCRFAGDSHWYLLRSDVGNAVDGELMVMVGLLDESDEETGS